MRLQRFRYAWTNQFKRAICLFRWLQNLQLNAWKCNRNERALSRHVITKRTLIWLPIFDNIHQSILFRTLQSAQNTTRYDLRCFLNSSKLSMARVLRTWCKQYPCHLCTARTFDFAVPIFMPTRKQTGDKVERQFTSLNVRNNATSSKI